MYVCMYVYIYIYIYTHTHTHTHICMYVYVCMCVCIYVCVYVYIYIYIYILHFNEYDGVHQKQLLCGTRTYIIHLRILKITAFLKVEFHGLLYAILKIT